MTEIFTSLSFLRRNYSFQEERNRNKHNIAYYRRYPHRRKKPIVISLMSDEVKRAEYTKAPAKNRKHNKSFSLETKKLVGIVRFMFKQR